MRLKIKNLIAQALGIEVTDVENEKLLREDLGLTDGDLTEIIVALNKEFEVNIPEENLGELRTVEDLIELVENYAPDEE